ncbi:YihY/virulence factor BrkB family protein [Novosphingobium sp. TH158]|uniref:YihY/virulence factor BrkB family protein n=1 Tax=Novosphingobium sp. TH158 TaxID=2067455 RepID=UPI000C7A3E8C|nr:YihY/virulence factor BrkB family protein [Novosphingobium sp. TH158]PLK27148.1 ribonuclease BN [Novosphingobium sp. TH158]
MEEHAADEPDVPAHVPDLSPEARRRRAERWRGELADRLEEQFGRGSRMHRVFTRVWTGAWNDGFIHAGNLAYTTIVALFPFFITVTAVFSAIGEPQERANSVGAFLGGLPPVVARSLAPVAYDVIELRHGSLLWIGGLVGLWTVGSLVETIRDVLRRAYGTEQTLAFWRYRLFSTGIIIVAVVALMFSLLAQVALGAAAQMVEAWSPRASEVLDEIALGRIVPALVLYVSLLLLFISLTPGEYRGGRYPKWPGAAFVTMWWVAVSIALPWVLRSLFHYDLTYGSLAGVMIALFFFWLVGLGLVVGAELNAALAESPEEQDLIERKASPGWRRKQRDSGEDTA